MALTQATVETMIVEMRDHLRVLRNEAVETRRVLKMLVGVITDTQQTNEALRQEMHHMRTAREREERLSVLAAAVADPT